MGFVDRGGGREAKGASLRRSKKNPGAASTRNKSSTKNYVTPATRAIPTPPAALLPLLRHMVAELADNGAGSHRDGREAASARPASPNEAQRHEQELLIQSVRQTLVESYPQLAAPHGGDGAAVAADALGKLNLNVDATVALLSRKLEGDVDGVFRRAGEEGHLSAMLCWCSEWERQALLTETCRNHNKLALLSRQGRAIGGAGPPGEHERSKKVRFADVEDGGEGRPEGEGAGGGPTSKKQQHGAVATSLIDGDPLAATKPSDVALYSIIGVHVNNIDRTSRKVQEQWVEDLGKQAKSAEVLGILSGLNLARESGTHYAQEWMLKECWRVAAELRLPLVLHVYTPTANKKEDADTAPAGDGAGDDAATEDVMVRTANRAAEVLQELLQQSSIATTSNPSAPVAIVLYNGLKVLAASAAMRELVRTHRPPACVQQLFGHDMHKSADGEDAVAAAAAAVTEGAVHVPMYVLVTAEGLCHAPPSAPTNEEMGAATPAPTPTAARRGEEDEVDLTGYLPCLSGENTNGGMALSQLLVGTGAPWATPQNLPDEHLRTLPNEPGNFAFVVKAVHDAMLLRCDAASIAISPTAFTESDVAGIALRNFSWAFFSDYLREQALKVIHGGASAPAVDEGRAHAAPREGAEAEAEAEDGDAEEGERRRFSSRNLRAAVSASHVDPAAVPTAFVCVKCRAPLFYPTALQHHRRGAGAVGAAASGGGKKPKAAKKARGRRGGSDSDDDGSDAPCPSASAHFLQATGADLSAAVEDAQASRGGVDADLLLPLIQGVQGQCQTGGLAFSHVGGGGKQRGHARGAGGELGVVACAACQTKLGDVLVDGSCYDCGAVLKGATMRLRPRAVEECPLVGSEPRDGKGSKDAAMRAKDGARRKAVDCEGDASGEDISSNNKGDDDGEEEDGSGSDNDTEDDAPQEALSELDLILAAAAREREALERERQAAEEGSHRDDDDERTRKKDKKKNVKANNRSNFSHFRNKDFAPRLAKEKKLTHQRVVEGYAAAEDPDEKNRAEHGSDAAKPTPTAEGVAGHHHHRSHSNSSSDDADALAAPAEESTMPTAATRRQRKKANRKRQQQHQQQSGGGADDEDGGNSD